MTEPIAPVTGTILHLQRLSTEDGPGIRTTVFFKGCPLACSWCHNPESNSRQPQVQWLENRCIGCLTCLEACPQHALTHTPQGMVRNREVCSVCSACVDACPAGAMELLGQAVEASALVKDLLKDRAYYEKSGGGVTFSGGEPTLQTNFALAVAAQLKAEGISLALDTCGLCSTATLEAFLPLLDIVLFDVKLIDPIEHQRWTGVANGEILKQLRWLTNILPAHYPHHRLWVRTPLIPGATDTRENIGGIGALLAEFNGAVERWEICAFNNLCRDKYDRLGLTWDFATAPLLTRAQLEQAALWANQSGFDPYKVFITGAARIEA